MRVRVPVKTVRLNHKEDNMLGKEKKELEEAISHNLLHILGRAELSRFLHGRQGGDGGNRGAEQDLCAEREGEAAEDAEHLGDREEVRGAGAADPGVSAQPAEGGELHAGVRPGREAGRGGRGRRAGGGARGVPRLLLRPAAARVDQVRVPQLAGLLPAHAEREDPLPGDLRELRPVPVPRGDGQADRQGRRLGVQVLVPPQPQRHQLLHQEHRGLQDSHLRALPQGRRLRGVLRLPLQHPPRQQHPHLHQEVRLRAGQAAARARGLASRGAAALRGGRAGGGQPGAERALQDQVQPQEHRLERAAQQPRHESRRLLHAHQGQAYGSRR